MEPRTPDVPVASSRGAGGETTPDQERPFLRRSPALVRGGLLALGEAALAVAFLATRDPGPRAGGVLLALLLGLFATPVALLERAGARGGPHLARDLAASLAAGLVGGLGLVAATLQVTYTAAILRFLDLPRALDAAGDELALVRLYQGEATFLVVAAAAPFAFATFARRRGLGLFGELAVGLGGPLALLLPLPGFLGFVGPPLPIWLLGTTWFHPSLTTFLHGQVFVLPALLPLVARAAGRLTRS